MATDAVKEAIIRQTDHSFWSETGYKPGKRLDPRHRDDAAMVPLWLAMNYAVVTSNLERLRLLNPTDPAIQQLTAWRHRLADMFAADPSLDQRARDMMQRVLSKQGRG